MGIGVVNHVKVVESTCLIFVESTKSTSAKLSKALEKAKQCISRMALDPAKYDESKVAPSTHDKLRRGASIIE